MCRTAILKARDKEEIEKQSTQRKKRKEVNLQNINKSCNDTLIYTDKTIYNFCAVIFEDFSKPYYYLANDETYSIGNKVVVPVGENNSERVAEIVSVEKHMRLTAPYPIEKVKYILRKYHE